MPISSNCLFHFTNKKQSLINILKSGLAPTYCHEEMHFKIHYKSIAIPMVSFCDIPLSQVKEHIKKYGSYAIGLSIDWAIKNKLNPVFYLEKGSDISTNIESLDNLILNNKLLDLLEKNKMGDDYTVIMNSLISTIFNLKNFEGDLRRKNKIHKKYKFYNEKEWRYIPIIKDDDKTPKYMFEKVYRAYRKKNPKKPLLTDYKLTFKSSDIKYIIINKDIEIPGILKALHEIDGLGSSFRDIEILGTKILTTKQIVEDF